ncbi:MAG: LysR family transcriptional regulator [Elioraea sp.]|nr:LysR family transcriptional regulator [Elioraea sp.]
MALELRQLQIIEAIARLGSVTRAAEELGLTQPAVSMQLKQIEQRIGMPLLRRRGRLYEPTEAGEEIVRSARQVAQTLADLDDALHRLRGLERGHLRLGVVSTANYFLPSYLVAFRRRHPGITVTLHVANRDQVVQALEDNLVEIAIIGRPPDSTELFASRFMDNPLVVIAPPDHPLACEAAAGREPISLDCLARQPFVMREPGSGTRAAFERVLAASGVRVQQACVLASNEAVKQAVQAGLGLAVISAQTVETELQLGRLVTLNVQGFPILRQWFVVHRAQRQLSPGARAFRDLLRELRAPSLGSRPRARSVVAAG